MQKITTSKKYRVNWLDVAKGFLVAAITAVMVTMGQAIEVWFTSPTFSINKVDLMIALKTAIGGGVAYLLKNFFTPTQTVIKGDVSDSAENVN